MPLRFLTTEQAAGLTACDKCGSRIGQRCDPAQLAGRTESHAARLKAARRVEFQREQQRAKRSEALKA